ncbi:MAG: sulfatase-like hydrolase/transferase, partial [Acidobacteriaceae bacterium]
MSESTHDQTRRIFLRNAAAAAGSAALGLHLAPQALAAEVTKETSKRPNLVFFCGEGVRPDETSLSGNKILKTPNLDRMGREGVIFNNAFCTNALCLPARASILSGMYSHTTGAVDNENSKVPDSFPLVSDMIRDSGYEVAFIGKSHVAGALLDRYWDYYFGFEGGASYFHPVIVEGFKGKYGVPKVYDDYVDDLLTKKAVEWLAQPHEKPVCLFLWFYAPHAPFYRPLRAVNRFNGVPIPKPESFDEYLQNYPGKPESVKKALNKIGTQFYEGDDPRSLEELVKDHYVGVETNDQHIGDVIQVIEKKGQMDDTAFLWSSDHG